MNTTKTTPPKAKRPPRKKALKRHLERYRAGAEEIAEAKQAMQRTHRGIEFEPERLHYVISSHST